MLTIATLFSLACAYDYTEVQAEVDSFNEETLEAVYDGDSVSMEIIEAEQEYIADEFGIKTIVIDYTILIVK